MTGNKPGVEELLERAARQGVCGYVAFHADHVDGMQERDDFLVAVEDEDCDHLTRGHAHEFGDCEDVLRVLVPEGMGRDTALRLLHKVVRWIEDDPAALDAAPPPSG